MQVEELCDRFEATLRAGKRPRIEDYLAVAPAEGATDLLAELIILEAESRLRAGETVSVEEYRRRFPECAGVEAAVAEARALVPACVPERVGRYLVRRRLGEGGAGVVYLAYDPVLDRFLAVKVLRSCDFARDGARQRFTREAQALARLDHPHIMPVLEIGNADGLVYLAMPYITGTSLREQQQQLAATPADAARLMVRIAEAVHYAHQRGVLHRDLKPSNILIDTRGMPFVSDFGLARMLDRPSEITVTGEVLGSPAYMAPEQATGERREASVQTDVYGLGATLYALLTGRAPFQGASALDIMDRVRREDPERPSRLNPLVDRDLEAICLKCLARKPAQRYESALAVAEDLRRYLNRAPVTAPPVSSLRSARRLYDRNPLAARLLMALILTVLAWLVSILWLLSRYEKRPPAAPTRTESRSAWASEMSPARARAAACSIRSASHGVNGRAAPGGGGSGTSRRLIA